MIQLRSLIALFVTSVVTVTLIVFGCSDELKEEKGDLGPEVDGQIVINAINSARGGRSIVEVNENEAVHFETNQKVEMGGPQIVLDEIFNVFHRAETVDNIKIVLTKTLITYPDGIEGAPEVQKIELDPIYIPKTNPQQQVSPVSEASSKVLYSPKQVDLLSRGLYNSASDISAKARKLTFHNFKVSVFDQAPPKNVREDPNCLGIPNCLLKATKVNFDLVEWQDEDWQKTNFEMILTSQATYLSTDLQICQGAFIYSDTAQRDFYVRQCRIVRDFRIK